MFRIVFRTLPPKNITWKSKIEHESRVLKSIRLYSEKSICPPPKPKKSSGGLVITLGAVALGCCGATIYYAKQDREFRQQLVTWLPFMDTVIKIIYQEGGVSISNPITTIQESLKHKQKKPSVTTESEEPDNKTYIPPTPILPHLEKDKPCPDSYAEIRLEVKEEGEEEPSVAIVGEPKPVDDKLPETHPKALEELEEQICVAATDAVNAYQHAIYIQKSYNNDIEQIIENNVDTVPPQTWDSVKSKTRDKNKAVKEAESKAIEATKKITKLKSLVSMDQFEAPESTKIIVKNNITKVQDDIDSAKKEFEQEKRKGAVTEKYWDKVERARKHFSDELAALFPDIDLNSKHLKVNEEDLDLFLLHVYATVLFYQKELAKIETMGKEKIRMAFERARAGKGEPLSPAEVCEMLDQEKRKLTLCFQQQCLKLRKQTEDEMREQMKRQSQAFSDHLDEAVRTREIEIERELSRKFDEQLEEERCTYKMQLAAMVGRLRGLDHAMKARRDADSTARQAQVLWSACQALVRSLRAGCPGVSWKEQIRPLEPELNAVKKAAGSGDELVDAVLAGIPEEAKKRGVFPEDALRERFLKVEKVARNVALVPEGGASLPVHLLSFIQGMFLLKAAAPIPQSELNDQETDFSKLDTNQILQRARYWLDRGNFEQTLKYMNLLRGAPRCVAKQWMNETRILLETQQAANTLMAHAASSGLTYL